MAQIDILATDVHDQPVMVVEIKSRLLPPRTLSELLARMQLVAYSLPEHIPYGMVVDPERTRIIRFDLGQNGAEDTWIFNTKDLLAPYDPGFDTRPHDHDYLRALTEAWLRDLAYHWKSEVPPGSDALAPTGLLERLEGGSTQREVSLGLNSLR